MTLYRMHVLFIVSVSVLRLQNRVMLRQYVRTAKCMYVPCVSCISAVRTVYQYHTASVCYDLNHDYNVINQSINQSWQSIMINSTYNNYTFRSLFCALSRSCTCILAYFLQPPECAIWHIASTSNSAVGVLSVEALAARYEGTAMKSGFGTSPK